MSGATSYGGSLSLRILFSEPPTSKDILAVASDLSTKITMECGKVTEIFVFQLGEKQIAEMQARIPLDTAGRDPDMELTPEGQILKVSDPKEKESMSRMLGLSSKVSGEISMFVRKYGRTPNAVFINASALPESPELMEIAGLRIIKVDGLKELTVAMV